MIFLTKIEMQANKDGGQNVEVAATTNMDEENENQDSIPPQIQLVATTVAGTSTGCTTRNIAANKTQTGQNKGGDTIVSFTTTKALKDIAANKK
uniref:Uncharacterized protein n=1 Tax=Setaria viridis TaxID=4556 RepID=A0A4U6VB92_SETVI|nr:hypothetical protein SEVIR_4G176100v2 [Setaria viridis]